MSQIGDFLIQLLSQFAGGPGPPENNLVRFGLAGTMWAVLLIIAWNRQRNQDRPRERLLVVAFGLALFRELFMLGHLAVRMVTGTEHSLMCTVLVPLEHALTLSSYVLITGAFLGLILKERPLTQGFMRNGLMVSTLVTMGTFIVWYREVGDNPGAQFHTTSAAWFLHLVGSLLIAAAILLLIRQRGWQSRVVVIALGCFFLSELLVVFNFVTLRAYKEILCPLGNSFYIWGIPLFGLVYYREHANEKRQAEEALHIYQDHLEELVEVRTGELTKTNRQLHAEIGAHARAERALARRNAELAVQQAIAGTVSQSLELDTILTSVLRKTQDLMNMEAGCVLLRDDATEHYTVAAATGTACNGEVDGASAQGCLCYAVAEQACQALEPVVVEVAQQFQQQALLFAPETRLRLLIGVPLAYHGSVSGALVLGNGHASELDAADVHVLKAIGQQIAVAIENARLYQQTERWARGMSLLNELSLCLNTTLDPVEIKHLIVRQSAHLLTCPSGLYLAWDAHVKSIGSVAPFGLEEGETHALVQKARQLDTLVDLIRSREAISIEDTQTDPRVPPEWRETLRSGALVCLPVWGREKALGCLVLMDRCGPRRWLAYEIELLARFTDRAGIALENAYLHKQMEWAAALEERNRISADMHDGLAQTLSLLCLRTDRAIDLLHSGNIAGVEAEFSQMRHATEQATRDVRRAITALRENPPPPRSLQEALHAVVEQFHKQGGPRIAIDIQLPEAEYPPVEQLEQVVQVVAEALQNARRHAAASRITLSLEKHSERLVLRVQDDGQGFDPAAPADGKHHFGISIMEARAVRIGGDLTVTSQPGTGTSVTLTLPAHSAEMQVVGSHVQREKVT